MSAIFAALAFAAAAAHSVPDEAPDGLATALFAGGCFWCVESDFEKVDGVKDVASGYTGGLKHNPSYESHDGHLEAVRVTYDPGVISYRKLVDYHLRHIDPLDADGQFCDRGHSYTTAIFASDADEWKDAQEAVAEAETILGKKVVTPVLDRGDFWLAESYHQDYYKKNPLRYKYYRTSCGRDARVKKIWAAPSR